jgi:thioredoxin reductase
MSEVEVFDITIIGLVVDVTQHTACPGVFAAGDVCVQVDVEPLNLIATGFSQAVVAANYAKQYADPGARVFPGHSSEMRL